MQKILVQQFSPWQTPFLGRVVGTDSILGRQMPVELCACKAPALRVYTSMLYKYQFKWEGFKTSILINFLGAMHLREHFEGCSCLRCLLLSFHVPVLLQSRGWFRLMDSEGRVSQDREVVAQDWVCLWWQQFEEAVPPILVDQKGERWIGSRGKSKHQRRARVSPPQAVTAVGCQVLKPRTFGNIPD